MTPFSHENLTFQPLVPERWDDFVALFSEHGVQNGCWCTYWRRTRHEYHHNFGERNKQFMQQVIWERRPAGLLAYREGKPIGWISVAPRTEFASLERSTTLKRVDDQPVWAIVCFFVSKPYRGQKMNQTLVRAAIAYAQANGAQAVEAYPFDTDRPNRLLPERYMGVLSTFQKTGFQRLPAAAGVRAVMRYTIAPPGIPKVEDALPDFWSWVKELTWRYSLGRLSAEETHIAVVEFFTPEVMEHIEWHIPGWIEMAGYARGQTLVHTVCMCIGMLASPAYGRLTAEEKRLLEWVSLLHDLAKQPKIGKRDHLHAFRSAAAAAVILPLVGFPTTDQYEARIEEWRALVCGAVRQKGPELIRDNARLRMILAGMDAMFGPKTPAARILQCILLHAALDSVPEWPCPGGLSDAEARQLIDPGLLPLLEATILADSDAWNLFDPSTRDHMRKISLEAMARIWPEID